MRAPLLAALAGTALACTARAPAVRPPPPPAAPAAPSPAAPSPDAPPLLELPDHASPLKYALSLEVVPGRPAFRGTGEILVELSAPRPFVWLHGRGLRVSKVTVQPWSGRTFPATWAQVNEDGVAKVEFPRELGPGKVTLRFAWEADFGGDLAGLYVARRGEDAYAATQLEPSDARRVFPCFDDPRFKAPFGVTLTVPSGAVAVSNAPAAAEVRVGDGLKRVRFAPTEPLPTHLVFLAVGPFDVVALRLPPNEVRPRALAVRGLAPRGHGAELAFALEASAAFVPWFERYFGIAFPYAKLDHVALPEFSWGGMENAGAIAYGDAYLLAPEGAPEAARREIAVTVAREISHQWFGDLVTLPWWTDAWLKEAFATWIGERAAAQWRPEWNLELAARRRVEDVMALDSLAASRAVRQPLAAMSEVLDQFDAMSREKGSAVLATFERLVGEERFREGVRAFLGAHRHGTGSATALYEALSTAAGRDLATALSSFIDRAGVPLVAARVACEDGAARLLLSQSRWVPRGSDAAPGGPWKVPVCARWEAAGRVQEGCTLLEDREGALPLGSECPAWVMPHAGAIGYQRWTAPPGELASLRAKGLPRLDAAEKISLARNLRAAQRTGGVGWGEAMGLIAELAADPDPEVAVEPAAILALAHDRLVPGEARAAVAAYARARYRPVLDRVGWDARAGESAATKRLRAEVIALLAFTAADADVLREAARRGAAFAGLDGAPPRRDALDPDLVEVALAAAVRERGAAAFDALLSRLATSEDAALRPRLVAALSHGDDAALAARAAGLWKRPEIRPHERRAIFATLGARAAGREALLAALEREADALLAALPPPGTAFFPRALSGACDGRSAERLRSALEPRLAAHPQMRRALAQTLEEIRVCAAERKADGAAAGAYFVRAAAAP